MTEKVRLEEDIKVSQAKLIQANKMTSLGMLVSGVAHEINNPNQCIAVNTSVLTNIWHDAAPIVQQYCEETGNVSLGGLPSREIQEMVPQLFSGIADSSQRINAIVANMRDYVRGGPGRKVPRALTSTGHYQCHRHPLAQYQQIYRQLQTGTG